MKKSSRFTETGLQALREAAAMNKPWLKSTGPRTTEGKRRSSRNSFKHGFWSAESISRRRRVRTLLALAESPLACASIQGGSAAGRTVHQRLPGHRFASEAQGEQTHDER